VTEHRAIIAAIRLRDAEKAAALTAAHVRVPAERLQATLAGSAHPHSTEPGPGDALPADAGPGAAVTVVGAGSPG
jgi:hypothetical protein